MIRLPSPYFSLLAVVLVLLIISVAFIGVSSIGEKTLTDETITLQPGCQKTYDLPPGMVKVEIVETGLPIYTAETNWFGGGYSAGTTGGYTTIGSPVFTEYTIGNPAANATKVHLRITTGLLNPFGYLGPLSGH